MQSKLEEFLRQTAESESLAQAVPWVQFRKHALGDDLGAYSALPGKDTCCLFPSSSKLKSLGVITMSHRRVQAGWSRGQDYGTGVYRSELFGRAWAAGLILNVMSCILSHTAQNRLSIVCDVKLQVRYKNSAESPGNHEASPGDRLRTLQRALGLASREDEAMRSSGQLGLVKIGTLAGTAGVECRFYTGHVVIQTLVFKQISWSGRPL